MVGIRWKLVVVSIAGWKRLEGRVGGLGEKVEGKGLVVGSGASTSYALDGGGWLW
jgi:hypothetical protein